MGQSSLYVSVVRLIFAAAPRCTECRSTLLPGSYKLGTQPGALVCTHHLSRHAPASQNGRQDLSSKPAAVQSARVGRSPVPHASLSVRDEDEAAPPPPPPVSQSDDSLVEESGPDPEANVAVTAEDAKVVDGKEETEEAPRSSSPPNPFDESDEEEVEEEKQEEEEPPAKVTSNGDVPSTPVVLQEGAGRPVPAPRRVPEPTPPPRPAPRVRLLRTADGTTAAE